VFQKWNCGEQSERQNKEVDGYFAGCQFLLPPVEPVWYFCVRTNKEVEEFEEVDENQRGVGS
jgi:hypothetical protein